MRDVVIVDSGGANLASLQFALERLGARVQVSQDAATIESASHVILPGVGAAPDSMTRLHNTGLAVALTSLRQPLLGICLGAQLLCERSEEGFTPCLGIFPTIVQRLKPSPERPVPHMGWNQLTALKADPLLEGIAEGDYVYFVHSYAAPVCANTLATTDYDGPLAAVVRRANFCGAQFHPERSAATGARLLENFLRL